MKLAVVFPDAICREGAQSVTSFIQGVERIGFDHLDVLDSQAPDKSQSTQQALDALAILGFAAASTSLLGLGAGSLMFPKREPILLAEQVNTIHVMSGGRMRLGISMGGEDVITLIRSHWRGDTLDLQSDFYRADSVPMLSTPQDIPIWIEGMEPDALVMAGRYGDGWSGRTARDRATVEVALDRIWEHAAKAGRDPRAVEVLMPLAPYEREGSGGFFENSHRLLARLLELEEMGFNWVSLDAASVCQNETPATDRLLGRLEELHEVLQPTLHGS